jgi:hypothetical protein
LKPHFRTVSRGGRVCGVLCCALYPLIQGIPRGGHERTGISGLPTPLCFPLPLTYSRPTENPNLLGMGPNIPVNPSREPSVDRAGCASPHSKSHFRSVRIHAVLQDITGPGLPSYKDLLTLYQAGCSNRTQLDRVPVRAPLLGGPSATQPCTFVVSRDNK